MLKKNKVLIVFVGHAFRMLLPNNKKTTDDLSSVEQQLKASNTHKYLVNYLTYKHKIQCDYCLATYDTIYKTQLLKYYPNSILNIFHNTSKGYQGLLSSITSQLKNSDLLKVYDTIFYIRIDLMLSEFLIKKIQPLSDYIYYTHLLGPPGDPNKPDMNCIIDDMYVCDMFMQVPERHFNTTTHNFLGHNSTKYLIKQHNINRQDIRFYIDTIHRASTHMSWNPSYIVTNRPSPRPDPLRALNPSVVYCYDSFKLKETNIFNNSRQNLINFYIKDNAVDIVKNNLQIKFSSDFLQIVEPKTNLFKTCESLN